MICVICWKESRRRIKSEEYRQLVFEEDQSLKFNSTKWFYTRDSNPGIWMHEVEMQMRMMWEIREFLLVVLSIFPTNMFL